MASSAALVQRALALLGEGEAGQARQLLEQASALDPRDPVPRHNLAELSFRQGRSDQAQRLFEGVLAEHPGFLPAYPSLLALLEQRRASDPAPAQDPRPMLLNNWANALLAHGRVPEAEPLYRQALALDPGYAHAWANLSNLLRLQMRLSEAEQTARQALAVRPDLPGAWVNLGCALEELACHGEAEACLQRALALQPDQPEARHNLGSGRLMRHLYRADLSLAELLRLHQTWGEALLAESEHQREAVSPPAGTAPRRSGPPGPAATPPPARAGRPRIAFLSSDLRRHAVTTFLEPLLEHLDRDRFDPVCLASVAEGDACTERLRRLPLEWHDVHQRSDAQLEELIRSLGIDLLIELNGHTRGTRLAALLRHPARLQASWLGYPFRTGLPSLDFRISDAWVLDGSEEPQGPERRALLDRCQFVYRPLAEAPEVSALPALERGAITFGSRSNLNKLTPPVLALWSLLLLSCPGSRLLLQASHLADPHWRGWLRGAFAAHGVPPETLLLLPYDGSLGHLEAYHRIDIALDPFPYNGITTSCDALWMGVPLVTLRGELPQGRGGVTLLEALGRADWIADTPEHYLAIARGLAVDPLRLSAERSLLRARMQASPLCREAEHARAFERCLERMLAGPAGADPAAMAGS